MRAWPIVSSWIFKNFEAAILKPRMRGLLMQWWSIWVDVVYPPPLVSSSDSSDEEPPPLVWVSSSDSSDDEEA